MRALDIEDNIQQVEYAPKVDSQQILSFYTVAVRKHQEHAQA